MNQAEGPLKAYRDYAAWWPLWSLPEDYAEEAEYVRGLFNEACAEPPRTLLELGSGGGNMASHLKQHYQMTLVDLSPGMVDVSRRLNPECEHVVDDMRTVRLGEQFDAVFIHDAIMYMLSEDDLRQALETAWVHCQPGGAAVLQPDFVTETFEPETSHGGHDGEGSGLRVLEWMLDPDPTDTTFITDYVFAFREADGSLRIAHDRHEEGLFPRATWLRLLREIGFEPKILTDPWQREVFVAVRPREGGADDVHGAS